MPLPGPLLDHLDIMVDLLRNSQPLSQEDLVRELKECKEAYKKVGGMKSNRRILCGSSRSAKTEAYKRVGGYEVKQRRMVYPF